MLMEEFEDLCSAKINISTFFLSMAWKLYPKLKGKFPPQSIPAYFDNEFVRQFFISADLILFTAVYEVFLDCLPNT